jgi:predicted O-methyltransferase YrrM
MTMPLLGQLQRVMRSSALHWLKYRLGLGAARTQVSPAERACLARHAANRKSLVEIGVMDGASTALLRGVMHPEGLLTGIDPHLPGRLGVSFERWIAQREVARAGTADVRLLRAFSHDAVSGWRIPIDFLFLDADHAWAAMDRDWRDWSGFVQPGGVVALHDSRPLPSRPEHDSVRYTDQVIRPDRRFLEIDAVESLTILARL